MSQNHGLKGLYVYIKNKEFLNRMKPDFEMEYSPIARFTNLTIKKKVSAALITDKISI